MNDENIIFINCEMHENRILELVLFDIDKQEEINLYVDLNDLADSIINAMARRMYATTKNHD